MAELTNEQLETALRVFLEYTSMPAGSEKRALRAAAPYLQIQWDEPTANEVNEYMALFFPFAMRPRHHEINALLEGFVRRRNAAIMPRPVDPRKEKIVRVLTKAHGHNIADPEAIAGFILNALDEEVRLSQDMYQNSTLYRDTATMPSPRENLQPNQAAWTASK